MNDLQQQPLSHWAPAFFKDHRIFRGPSRKKTFGLHPLHTLRHFETLLTSDNRGNYRGRRGIKVWISVWALVRRSPQFIRQWTFILKGCGSWVSSWHLQLRHNLTEIIWTFVFLCQLNRGVFFFFETAAYFRRCQPRWHSGSLNVPVMTLSSTLLTPSNANNIK